MAGSTTKEPEPASTTDTTKQASTASAEAVEEIKKEFAENNQHNVPRDKREGDAPRRPFRGARNKKEYQRTRGRNKR